LWNATKEDEWKAAGRIALPSYVTAFAAEDANPFFEKQLKQAEKEAERNGRRQLSPAQTAAKEILEDAVQEFAPEIWESFGSRRPNDSVAETETLLGQFQKALPCRTSQLFLAASVFESGFATAISVFLHEHSHIYGYDRGREFTDALTWLIAAVIRNRKGIDEFERKWNKAIRKIASERKAKSKRPGQELKSKIAAFSEAEMRELLSRLPPSQVEHLANELQRERDTE